MLIVAYCKSHNRYGLDGSAEPRTYPGLSTARAKSHDTSVPSWCLRASHLFILARTRPRF